MLTELDAKIYPGIHYCNLFAIHGTPNRTHLNCPLVGFQLLMVGDKKSPFLLGGGSMLLEWNGGGFV